MLSSDKEYEKHGWVTGPDLWRVAFTLGSVCLISRLSGLVHVYAVEYDNYGNVLLYVRKKYPQSSLFIDGEIKATKAIRFRPPPQGIRVEATDYTLLNAVLS